MAKVNDYSGFNQVFRDTVLGVALSAGGLSTLLPNVLEALSETRDLATSEALNFFSVIYFIIPILLFTSYWLSVGHKKYITPKIPDSLLTDYQKKQNLVEAKTIKSLILSFAKISPIFLFITGVEFFKSIPFGVICGYYGVLALLEVTFITRYIYHITSRLPEDESAHRSALRAKGFRINILIFTLDMFIGLALAVFNEPWVVYQGSFYAYFTSILGFYAVIGLSIHWTINKATGISYDLVIVWLAIVTLGLCVPAVNLQASTIMATIILVVTIVLMVVMAWPLKTLADYFKIIFPAGVFFLIYLTVAKSLEGVNRNYLENRIEAARQMPTDKIFPFYFYKTQTQISISDALAKARTIDSINHRSIKDPLKTEYLEKTYQKEFNVRAIYYGNYDMMLKKKNLDEEIKIIQQHQIDTFYNSLVDRLEKQLFPIYFGKCRADTLMKSTYELREYIHPINFYARYLVDEREQRDDMREVVKLLERMRDYRSVIFNLNRSDTLQLTKDYKEIEKTFDARITRIQDIRGVAERFRIKPIDSVKRSEDSLHIQSLLFLSNQILAVQESRYEKVYQGGQKIYRSYLVDSQRVGVYIFFTTLIVLALAWFFYVQDESIDKYNESAETESLGPRQLFFIQTLSVFILLIPLIRPIKPENIDPEKPYWMMTLQNWHAPSFTASHTYKKPPSSGANGLTPLIDLLKGVREDLHDLNEQVDSVSFDIQQLEPYEPPTQRKN